MKLGHEMLKMELLNTENSNVNIEEHNSILGYLMSRSVFEEHQILNVGVPQRQKKIGTILISSF